MSALTRANTDDQVITLWLHDRPSNTQDAYRRDVAQFLQRLAGRGLQLATLEDVQGYATALTQQGLSDASKRRKLNAVKSLFTFATKLNYTRFNVAAAVRMPKASHNLAGRILKPSETKAIVQAKTGVLSDRNQIFLTLTYAVAGRVSEVCSLRWQDFTERLDGKVQVTLSGKGDKSGQVIVPDGVWRQVQTLRGNAQPGDKVFGFGRRQAHNIIKAAVAASGLNSEISCHWLRHAHAMHSLKNGAPLHVVRDTLRHANISTTNWYLESMPDESSSDFLGF
jgi:integrase/recombinase XerD